MREMGIEGYSKKQGSKSGMTSKGGKVGKKEREVLNMTKGNLGFEIQGVVIPEEKETGKKKGGKAEK